MIGVARIFRWRGLEFSLGRMDRKGHEDVFVSGLRSLGKEGYSDKDSGWTGKSLEVQLETNVIIVLW